MCQCWRAVGAFTALHFHPPTSPWCPFPWDNPFTYYIRPVVDQQVARDHRLISGEDDLLQKLLAQVLLHPGVLESGKGNSGRKEFVGRGCEEDGTGTGMTSKPQWQKKLKNKPHYGEAGRGKWSLTLSQDLEDSRWAGCLHKIWLQSCTWCNYGTSSPLLWGWSRSPCLLIGFSYQYFRGEFCFIRHFNALSWSHPGSPEFHCKFDHFIFILDFTYFSAIIIYRLKYGPSLSSLYKT